MNKILLQKVNTKARNQVYLTLLIQISILILVVSSFSQVSEKKTDSTLSTTKVYNCEAVRNFFIDALVSANKPGGLMILRNSCSDNAVFPEIEKLSLDEKLDLIIQMNPNYRWSDEQGFINLTPNKLIPELLNVQISNFKVADVNNLNLVIDRILQLSEVSEKLKQLKIKQGMQFGGIMSPPGKRPPTEMEFKDKTLQQILNEIVKKRGRGVWVYNESCFNGEDTFSLDFLVQ